MDHKTTRRESENDAELSGYELQYGRLSYSSNCCLNQRTGLFRGDFIHPQYFLLSQDYGLQTPCFTVGLGMQNVFQARHFFKQRSNVSIDPSGTVILLGIMRRRAACQPARLVLKSAWFPLTCAQSQ